MIAVRRETWALVWRLRLLYSSSRGKRKTEGNFRTLDVNQHFFLSCLFGDHIRRHLLFSSWYYNITATAHLAMVLIDIRCGSQRKKNIPIGKLGLLSVHFGPVYDQNCSFSYRCDIRYELYVRTHRVKLSVRHKKSFRARVVESWEPNFLAWLFFRAVLKKRGLAFLFRSSSRSKLQKKT